MVAQLLGPDGRPISSSLLSTPIAEPQLGGVRNIFSEFMSPGLSPERLANIMRNAAEGFGRDYLTLAEEMEERELHYAAVLRQRKLAVAGISPVLDEDNSTAEITKRVHELINDPEIFGLVTDMLDGLAKGYSCVEMIWGERDGLWWPVEYAWRDPRLFVFDIRTKSEVRLAVDGLIEGVELPPGKFIVHKPRLKTGIPLRGGLARAAAFAYMIKSFSLKDWLAFCEVYGMPIRIGKYHAGASEEDRRKLLRAVSQIGIDAAAIIPEAMQIDFHEVKTGANDVAFENLARFVDEQVSKLVQGQTMTSDDGASRAQAVVHNEVRLELTEADTRDVARALNRDLIPWFVSLNFGPQKKYPKVRLPVAKPEDIKVLTEALVNLIPMGLKVSESEIRSKIGLRDPEKGEHLLTAPKADTIPAVADKVSTSLTSVNLPEARGFRVALARAQNRLPAEITDDEIEAEALSGWRQEMNPIFEAVQSAAEKANSYEEFMAALDQLQGDLPIDELMKGLFKAGLKARVGGAVNG